LTSVLSCFMVMDMVMKSNTAVPRTLPAGQFKAKCLELMDRVQATGCTVVITKRGRPVARLAPVVQARSTLAGFSEGTVEILGDILGPLDLDFEAFR
jgi:prevent-host-death family protein